MAKPVVWRCSRVLALLATLVPFLSPLPAQQPLTPDPGEFGEAPLEPEIAALEKAIEVLETVGRSATDPNLRVTSEYAAITMRNKLQSGRIRCGPDGVGPTGKLETDPPQGATIVNEAEPVAGGHVHRFTTDPGNIVWIRKRLKNGNVSVYLASVLLHEAVHCVQEGETERDPAGGPCDPDDSVVEALQEVEAHCWQITWIEAVESLGLEGLSFSLSIADQRLMAGGGTWLHDVYHWKIYYLNRVIQ